MRSYAPALAVSAIGAAVLIWNFFSSETHSGNRGESHSPREHTAQSAVYSAKQPPPRVMNRRYGLVLMGEEATLPPELVERARIDYIASSNLTGLAALITLSNDLESKKELAKNPEDPLVCRILASTSDDPSDRLKWAEQWTMVRPDDPSAKIAVATALASLGRNAESVEILLDLQPQDPLTLIEPETVAAESVLWALAGESTSESKLLTADTGYSKRVFDDLSVLISSLVVPGSDRKISNDNLTDKVATRSLELIASLKSQLPRNTSIQLEKRLVATELRSLEFLDPNVAYGTNSTVGAHLEELTMKHQQLNVSHQYLSGTLYMADKDLADQFLARLSESDLPTACREVLGAPNNILLAVSNETGVLPNQPVQLNLDE